jgi:hypothetical protein
MSSVQRSRTAPKINLEMVGMMRGLLADLAGHRPNEHDSEETVDYSGRKSSVTKRYRASISDEPVGHLTNYEFSDRYRKLVDVTSSREETAILAVETGSRTKWRRKA